jgi:hypothetical protein
VDKVKTGADAERPQNQSKVGLEMGQNNASVPLGSFETPRWPLPSVRVDRNIHGLLGWPVGDFLS